MLWIDLSVVFGSICCFRIGCSFSDRFCWSNPLPHLYLSTTSYLAGAPRLMTVRMTMTMNLMLFACIALIASFCTNSSVFAEAFILPGGLGFVGSVPYTTTRSGRNRPLDFAAATAGNVNNNSGIECKICLLSLLAKVPSNQSTPKELTRDILDAVSVLEREYPTSEADVVARLAGECSV